ncbi:MAG: hypothetical protein LBS62_00815 [Clostridiales bacterium]|jgi:hypothetical protein|nr:hypothetical protein [Clostridiales bacterium]
MVKSTQTIKFLKGDIYTGEVKDGAPCGKGKLNYANGDIYVGDFVSLPNGSILNGMGLFTHANGSWCKGVFKNNNFVGGTMYSKFSNGGFYEGGARALETDVVGASGHCYEQGQGKLTYADGSVYIGTFDSGKCHGKGKLTRPNGTCCEGEFKNGEFAAGKKTFENGAFFEGEFCGGKFARGVALIKYDTGTVYNGEYANDKYKGKGKLSWASGNVYEGEFFDSRYYGHGKLTLANGMIYEGEFSNGKFIEPLKNEGRLGSPCVLL